MAIPAGLLDCAGRWHGTSRLQDPHTGGPDDSTSVLTVTPALQGRFVRVDYTWAYRGDPQEGSILIGHALETGVVTAHWADTWHMSDAVLACRGTVRDPGVVIVEGSYPAPPGPDWGWRITLAAAAGLVRLVMHNISPEGKEDVAVEASYTRG